MYNLEARIARALLGWRLILLDFLVDCSVNPEKMNKTSEQVCLFCESKKDEQNFSQALSQEGTKQEVTDRSQDAVVAGSKLRPERTCGGAALGWGQVFLKVVCLEKCQCPP